MKLQMLIEVKDTQYRQMSGIAKRTGRPYTIREQSGWADVGKPYPVEVRWLLEDTASPFPVGRYVVDESALIVDRNGQVQIDLRKMKPVAVASGAQAQGK